MRQILDAAIEQQTPPIWRQAFRPFFLFGAAFSALAVALWVFSLLQQPLVSPPLGLHFWHSHEMIFGFVAAIIAGFLLTAVQNWTGLRAINDIPLITLFSVWALGRLFNLVDLSLPVWFIAAVQAIFWLGVIYHLVKPVWLIRQFRNLIFLPILSIFCLLDVTSYYVAIHHPLLLQAIPKTSVFLVLLLMTVISGRVFPMFTANGTNTPRANINKKLEFATIAISILLVAAPLLEVPLSLSTSFVAGLYILAAVLHALRAIQWKPWVTLTVPLVWSLHLSYWFIPLGLLLIALNKFGFAVTYSSGLHAITLGAMSLMILAMISRISLGHSGRPIIPAASVKYSFWLLALAAICRVMAEFVHYQTLLISAAVMFVLAFTVFIMTYFKILTSPRADGRPG